MKSNLLIKKLLGLVEMTSGLVNATIRDSTAIFIFLCHSRFPLKTVHPFCNFLVVLPPPTLYKVETRKKFWIHASNIVCGVRGGVVDLYELENAPETQKCPKTFVHDCLKKRWEEKGNFEGFSSLVKCFFRLRSRQRL